MPRARTSRKKSLVEKYPPSEPCGCPVCLGYCVRPGWWTVAEAELAIRAGHTNRMMLEIAPEHSFGVLSPAFKGNESAIALNSYAKNGCNYLSGGLCELHGTGFQPLECRFCHHDRPGQGPICHADIEHDWNTDAGRALVKRWSHITGVWEQIKKLGFGWLLIA